jgi:hypothetical protein
VLRQTIFLSYFSYLKFSTAKYTVKPDIVNE